MERIAIVLQNRRGSIEGCDGLWLLGCGGPQLGICSCSWLWKSSLSTQTLNWKLGHADKGELYLWVWEVSVRSQIIGTSGIPKSFLRVMGRQFEIRTILGSFWLAASQRKSHCWRWDSDWSNAHPFFGGGYHSQTPLELWESGQLYSHLLELDKSLRDQRRDRPQSSDPLPAAHSSPACSSACRRGLCSAPVPCIQWTLGNWWERGWVDIGLFLLSLQSSSMKRASLVAQLVKNPHAMRETWVWSLVGKILWRRERLPTPVFWPGEFHRLYGPWGHKESNTTERLSFFNEEFMDIDFLKLWLFIYLFFF